MPLVRNPGRIRRRLNSIMALPLSGAKKMARKRGKKMTVAEKYASLKRQTERAGMEVIEEGGRLVVRKKK